MFQKKIAGTLLCLVVLLGFSAVSAMGSNILFITSFEDEHMPGDDALKVFMEGLGHTVTYLDDDEDEATTEAAAIEADLVFISESVGSGKVREEITEIETPMVITESWAWDEMGLTKGGGAGQDVVSTDIEIVEPGHPLAAGLSGTVSVLTDISGDLGVARFSNGIAGDEATVIARAKLTDGQTYDVVMVYEKGAALAVPPTDGSAAVAADIRICIGFDYRSYPLWNLNAYLILEAAINHALGLKPLSTASIPKPHDGAFDVAQDSFLSWKAGAYANKHDVYLGTVLADVNEADRTNPMNVLVSENQDIAAYDPPDLFDFGQTYYWRVDEINDLDPNSPWRGDVWSFTTINHLTVDNFESYNDIDPPDPDSNRIFEAWIDGFGTTDNGALVGNELPPYAEQTTIHGGKQSMPFFYNNNMKYSEAVKTLDSQRDWTKNGVTELSLWFKGYPEYVGSFVEAPVNTYTMTGTGWDIWGTADEFHFAYKTLSGVGSIVAKVLSVDNTDPWAKAGVMIRETLEPGSKFAAVYITPGNGCRLQVRTNTDGDATSDTSVATSEQIAINAPYWIKLERDAFGNFRGYYSSDGMTWQQLVWRQSIPMSTDVYVGLAVTSHNVAATCQAKFSNVMITGTAGTQWADRDIGINSNVAESMYIVVDGNAVVYYENPNASLIDVWTQWIIPLQEFADRGVDLSNVNSIGIGLGDRDNPQQPGGSGKMYFDDIRLYKPLN